MSCHLGPRFQGDKLGTNRDPWVHELPKGISFLGRSWKKQSGQNRLLLLYFILKMRFKMFYSRSYVFAKTCLLATSFLRFGQSLASISTSKSCSKLRELWSKGLRDWYLYGMSCTKFDKWNNVSVDVSRSILQTLPYLPDIPKIFQAAKPFTIRGETSTSSAAIWNVRGPVDRRKKWGISPCI